MTPSYRLDNIAGQLIERLEGARRTWAGDDEAAHRELEIIARNHLASVVAEHDDLIGTPGWGETLSREITQTFLPRYLRLAVAQNHLESTGYGAWRNGDVIGRFVGGAAALVGWMVIARLVHHPAALAGALLALSVPFFPDIRRFAGRRRYRRELQSAVDDLARIQTQIERLPIQDDWAEESSARDDAQRAAREQEKA